MLEQHKEMIRKTAAQQIKLLERESYRRQLQRTEKMEEDLRQMEADLRHAGKIEEAKKEADK